MTSARRVLLCTALLALTVACHGERELARASAKHAKRLDGLLKAGRLQLVTASRQAVDRRGALPVAARQWQAPSLADVHYWGRRACDMANAQRAQWGRPALSYSGTLSVQSRSHSHWMSSWNLFQHQNVGALAWNIYDTQWNRYIYFRATGENIATAGWRSWDVANDFHWQWVYSPPHYQNMMGTGHTHCGVGFYWDGWRIWGTQLFGAHPWNQWFGNELDGVTPR